MPKKGVDKRKGDDLLFTKPDVFSYLLALTFAILVVFFTTSKISNEDDMFWHLSTGRYILEHKVIPSTDVFSYTTLGQEWIPFEWGWDVISYYLYSISGFTGISILNSLLYLIIFSVIFLVLRKFGLSYPIIFLFLIFFLFGIFDRIIIRPHVFSYLFIILIISIFILNKYFNRTNIRLFYFLPFIFLLWVNIHMGVLAGVIIFGLFILSEYFTFLKPKIFSSGNSNPLGKNELMRITIIFIISLLVLLVNPHPFQTFSYVYSHLTMKHLGAVNEWISPFNSLFVGRLYVIIYITFLITGLLVLYYAYKQKDLFAALLYLAFGINSVRAIRYTVDFLVVIIIYFVITIHFLITLIKSNRFKSFIFKPPIPDVILVVFCLLLIFNIPHDKLYHNYLKYPRFTGVGIDSTYFPTKLIDFMKESKVTEIGERPFNYFECGGFFTWNFPGKLNFIDSRNVNEYILNEYSIIFSMGAGYENEINKYNIDYAICFEKDMVLKPQFMHQFIISHFASKPDQWKLIFWDDKSFLFVKNEHKFEELISKYEYKYLNPYNFMFQKQVIEKGINENTEQVKKEMDRKAIEEPDGYYINYIHKIYGSKIH